MPPNSYSTTAGSFIPFTVKGKPNLRNPFTLILILLVMFQVGGERGIRTLDTLLEYARFPGVCLKPLGHLSRNLPTVDRIRINALFHKPASKASPDLCQNRGPSAGLWNWPAKQIDREKNQTYESNESLNPAGEL
jgi:hypothetical protein